MSPSADDTTPLEPVRRLRTALAMADYSSTLQVGKMLTLAHPLIEVRSVPGIAPGPAYIGHAEVERYFTEAAKHEATAEAVIVRAEVTETGNVLTAGRLVSRTNQASASISAWFVYRFRDGLISAIETYLDAATACEQAQRRTEGSD